MTGTVERGGLLRPLVRRLHAWRALRRARAESRERLARVRPRRLLVVCYGNIYRSPFAAAVLSGVTGIEVRSAGFHPRVGRETPAPFQEVVRRYGVDLSAHRSCALDPAIVAWADVVIVMDRHNWDRLKQDWPQVLPKVVWLGGFVDDGPVEIIDPYGRSVSDMQIIAERLHRACTCLVRTLSAA